jgi:hypothetical protein
MAQKFGTIVLASLAGLLATGAADAGVIRHVFVIAMENTDRDKIYKDRSSSTAYLQTLLRDYAHADNFIDELPGFYSEPHYLWMEAGTNVFSDHTFTRKDDADASRSNSTGSGDHLVAQIKGDAKLSWMTYQEGVAAGSCPIRSGGDHYAAKHNPFVFFQDVSGDPPSPTNAYCAAHVKPYKALAQDLHANDVADYVFITPNLCNDMHGAFLCNSDHVGAGDSWLKSQLPPLVSWAKDHSGVIFVTWDQGSVTNQMPFIAIGPGVKPGYAGAVRYGLLSLAAVLRPSFDAPLCRRPPQMRGFEPMAPRPERP